jgi:hypothetical protein|tara:strand:- start:359 stop:637 length:279 start_codon:yes stop_codon:yes gene_type:complete
MDDRGDLSRVVGLVELQGKGVARRYLWQALGVHGVASGSRGLTTAKAHVELVINAKTKIEQAMDLLTRASSKVEYPVRDIVLLLCRDDHLTK